MYIYRFMDLKRLCKYGGRENKYRYINKRGNIAGRRQKQERSMIFLISRDY